MPGHIKITDCMTLFQRQHLIRNKLPLERRRGFRPHIGDNQYCFVHSGFPVSTAQILVDENLKNLNSVKEIVFANALIQRVKINQNAMPPQRL